jgi:hypothetical protein
MKGAQFSIDSKTANICKKYAEATGLPSKEVFRLYFDSTTYKVLCDMGLGVYAESFECVYDMFEREMKGDDWE